MPAKTTKTTTKKAAAAKPTPAAKPEKVVEPKPAAEPKDKALTPNQLKILGAIAASKTPLTYGDVRQATGLKKGLTKAMAKVSSKGTEYPASLEGRGLIASAEAGEDVKGQWTFAITAAGKKALAESKK